MIIKETMPGTSYKFGNRSYYDFSEEEKQRVKEILEELKDIFHAESVGLRQKTLCGNSESKNDWIIEINSVPNTGIPIW